MVGCRHRAGLQLVRVRDHRDREAAGCAYRWMTGAVVGWVCPKPTLVRRRSERRAQLRRMTLGTLVLLAQPRQLVPEAPVEAPRLVLRIRPLPVRVRARARVEVAWPSHWR